MPEVVYKLSGLIGRPMLPPRWTLGYLGSTMAYTEAPNAQERLAEFAALCREHRIPCDGFHLSSGEDRTPLMGCRRLSFLAPNHCTRPPTSKATAASTP